MLMVDEAGMGGKRRRSVEGAEMRPSMENGGGASGGRASHVD